MERDTPSQVKAIQTRWQAQAKELALPQRDERALWEQFRAACDAVFQAREAKRKHEDDKKHEGRRALEDLCAELEKLVQATDTDDQELRRALRDLGEQWKQKTRRPNEAPRGLEARFTNARTAVEGTLSLRARTREAAAWQTLTAKERLCETLESGLRAQGGDADAAASVVERWAALPALQPAGEKAMLARRDAAIRALSDEAVAAEHLERIESAAESRREVLLELEMQLGLEIPPELQAQRLALQVKRLRDRFQDASTSGARTPGDRLLAWCAEPGIADAQERQRVDRVFAAMERMRGTDR
jgi:hypothetical protein